MSYTLVDIQVLGDGDSSPTESKVTVTYPEEGILPGGCVWDAPENDNQDTPCGMPPDVRIRLWGGADPSPDYYDACTSHASLWLWDLLQPVGC